MSKEDFINSKAEVEDVMYGPIIAQLRVIEETQFRQYGEDSFDVNFEALVMGYFLLRNRGWTLDEIISSLTELESYSDFD